jgi:hypothetical protein
MAAEAHTWRQSCRLDVQLKDERTVKSNAQAQRCLPSINKESQSPHRFRPKRRAPPGEMMATLVVYGVLVAFPAAADTLSDLRAVLQRYPAKAPFSASASLRVNDNLPDVTSAEGGSTTFDVEFGPSGLMLRVPPSALGAAESEAADQKRDPEHRTPTRLAMVSLTTFDVIDAVNSASMLLNDLNCATLIMQSPSTHGGKPATLLRIKVKTTLAAKSSRFVKEPQVELRIWIDSNGIPIAAERESLYAAAFLFVKAGNVRKERWEFAVSGDHLYASRNEQENHASALGKNVASSRTVSYVPRASGSDAANSGNNSSRASSH